MSEFEAVIGVETHVELNTLSKMFCGCPVSFGDEPNTNCCPVCLGLPGALPVPNEAAVEAILRIGASLDCTLEERSLFHRKNYFYPDLPKNYQISQYDLPFCTDGHLDVIVDGETVRVGITRVHMEEDTGKSLHVGEAGRIHSATRSLLDFNRSGVPLVEIVTEPDLRTPEQARAYGIALQQVVRALGVSDAKLEEGSMRFDANISLRPVGRAALGTRTEVKNVNSLRSLQQAIAHEIDRQGDVLRSGGSIVQETRHWNEDTGTTSVMRSKEESEDYRYFEEPDLLPVRVDGAWRDRIVASLPELPWRRRERLVASGLDDHTADLLVDAADLAGLFDDAVEAGAEPRLTGNWLTGEVVAYLRREGIGLEAASLTPAHLAELSTMVGDSLLSATAAKEVLAAVLAGEGTPGEVAEHRDLLQVSDAAVLGAEVDAVLAANEDALARMREGDMKPVGFLVGQVMKATGGKADPKLVSEMIRRRATR